ncbi:MAG: hypothetical protein A3F26_00325 [Candidatus Ryanbacteria bacterium RIFCSPHIGHO2_12_FULL_47_12b]|uniref:Uncharacterized protein n=2 Tax=Candidatus Ryaniibacteriota TaxID=1817914 RepID=A0A1G2H4A3_9BACT|nr:MAG: hypothetical protein UY14_C0016G0014 [Parcubacteria group bacterium GW2011_GWA1_47_9]OGZ46899.1 MAG: hypothetical protein A2844_00115 [Candidatus Ryanbacteria bacterium RIFCSPHIGHO2_01_FULL_48_80]OGZ50430.1 MAG: hypothetical protein A3C83_00100 [Candidatus Ryanbacteria bacterium RIFCSPHIGHO2_02_FULL_47_25]OGZ51848.1 MAG: hypothetical protein A3F26_00325 [Candidatus Ryanbacteria bacterium RIFCSPHIGHO2_12_FULL_47_12b]OGZ53104.1 MAG: hypothetical protein A3A29_02455 [Candidatus Ryanbacteri
MRNMSGLRTFYVSGQPVELWENPVVPFGWTQDDIEAYAAINDWELLFNALAIGYFIEASGIPAQ